MVEQLVKIKIDRTVSENKIFLYFNFVPVFMELPIYVLSML